MGIVTRLIVQAALVESQPEMARKIFLRGTLPSSILVDSSVTYQYFQGCLYK